jgi:hypothetical protein
MRDGIGRSPFEDGNSPHRGTSPAAYPERQANKAEAPTSDKLVQVDHVFVMSKTQLPTNAVNLLIGNVAHTR